MSTPNLLSPSPTVPAALDPTPATPARLIGDARELVARGNIELALIDYGRALHAAAKGSPEFAAAAGDIGVIHYRSERPDLARGFLEAAAEAAPNDALLVANLREFRANAPQEDKPHVALTEEGGPSSVGHWVLQALEDCDQFVGFAGKDVVEIGGSLPPEVANALNPRTWTSIDPGATPVRVPRHTVLDVGAEAIPVEDASFDVAFSCCAFEHIPDLRAVLAEIARVLRPGGALFSQFSPIWSSETGDHVWIKDDADPLPLLTFSDGILPPWAHLLWSAPELASFVALTHGAHNGERAAQNVFQGGHINRLFEDDYFQLFDECPLIMERLEPFAGVKEPAPETMERLTRRHPGRRHFSSAGFRLVMRKP